MKRTITLALALAMVIGSIVFFHRPLTHAFWSSGPADPQTCGDQYNALLSQAKQALARNDRAGAVHSLIEAREQLKRCQELHQHDAEASSAVALNTF
jgi:hypothetical protein